jgi:WD40 repeat protein
MKRFLACAVVLAGLLGCKPGKPLHTTYKGSPTEVDTFPGRVTAMALDPTTGNLALGFSDSLVSIWNPTAHKAVLQIRKHRHIINGVAFSPDGKLLAAASADEVFTISDARTGQLIDSVVMFQGPVTNVDFSSDGKYLAGGTVSFS